MKKMDVKHGCETVKKTTRQLYQAKVEVLKYSNFLFILISK